MTPGSLTDSKMVDSDSRKNLAREMMNRMMSIFKEEPDTEGQ